MSKEDKQFLKWSLETHNENQRNKDDWYFIPEEEKEE